MRRTLTHRRPIVLALAHSVVLLVAAAADDEPKRADPADLAGYDALIKLSDREHWAFQPVRRPAVPAVKNAARVRNPIDAFMLEKLEARGWQPSPPAEPRALLRRVHLDLIGLPPTIDEQQAFLADPSPEALDRVIDELLARPQYGERWGRHWLDLVRFAESNGYELDGTKPNAWRYRDYVIRSFNDDKPFDRFILEQLAGDELDDAKAETLIATGFYRLGPWDDEPADPKEDRFDQLDDIVSTASQVFLGLTLGCCRCHNHKFDPLTMHDYYRLVATFNGLVRPQAGRTELDLPVGTRPELAALAERDRQIAAFGKEIADAREAFRATYLATGQSSLPAEVLGAFRAEPGKRTDAQKKLVTENTKKLDEELSAAMPAETKQKIMDAEQAIHRLREATPDLPRAYLMHEPSPTPPATHLLLRGKAARPGPRVEPGLPAVLVKAQPALMSPSTSSSQRRLSLARWTASPDNPLAARVMVNRVWQFHFGEGLVRTPSDFGKSGDRPSHPELLDWLAREFTNPSPQPSPRRGEGENEAPSPLRGEGRGEGSASAWRLKHLHRLIMTSNTYRMSKQSNPRYVADDPENRLLWRFPYRRLEVEAIRDSMLAVSGQLNPKMYGPSMYPSVPKEALEGNSDPDKIWKTSDESESSRRTIYAFVKRAMVIPMLEALDLCDTTRSAAKRSVTTVAPQALSLFNGDFVNRQAEHFAARLAREAGDDPAKQIELAYRLALCREPTATERTAMFEFLDREANSRDRDPAGAGGPSEPDKARRNAVEQMCRVVLNLNEFVYPD